MATADTACRLWLLSGMGSRRMRRPSAPHAPPVHKAVLLLLLACLLALPGPWPATGPRGAVGAAAAAAAAPGGGGGRKECEASGMCSYGQPGRRPWRGDITTGGWVGGWVAGCWLGGGLACAARVCLWQRATMVGPGAWRLEQITCE